VRELAGKPVTQVILGGDSGASLRDLLAAAALLKSKRVPPRLDLLVAPPSRQALEVLAQSGALVDLIATGARLIEPDPRLVTGELYPPLANGVSMRTFDPEPGLSTAQRFMVASAETLAYAVATGSVGDPRSFKRPVRVTVPRTLPTDEVLIVRKGKSKQKDAESSRAGPSQPLERHGWNAAATLDVVAERGKPRAPCALVFESLDDVRWAARRAPELSATVRAVIAPHIPAGTVPIFAGLGILALRAEPDQIKKLRSQSSLGLPDPTVWDGKQQKVGAGAPSPSVIVAMSGSASIDLTYLAIGAEREWTTTGSAGGKH
jgi:aconitate hydratase